MGMARLVVTAVLVEGRPKSEVACEYGVSRRWVITLVRRYLAEGEPGLAPRSRRPLVSPQRTVQAVEDEIVELRKELDRIDSEASISDSRLEQPVFVKRSRRRGGELRVLHHRTRHPCWIGCR